MDFRRLVDVVGEETVFDTGLLLAGNIDPASVRRQLSRWTKEGRLYQLRRGLYALAPPFQKIKPHPFLVANRLVRGSYVSCQSALGFYGLIPEIVPVVISVTTRRPASWDTPLGRFRFHHIKADFLTAYRLTELDARQRAFVASPEKALLDQIYLQPGGDSRVYLEELRLQHLDRLDLDLLRSLADRSRSPKLRRAAREVTQVALQAAQEYEML